jgi:WS/DGAT/MGAT family acyltransferase
VDVSLLYLERRATPMHIGTLAALEPTIGGEDFDYERLVALVERRIALVPRYRQRVQSVPAHLANPVWVDDVNFDITYHVRRSNLPKPGTDEQLREFCARIQSRPLDRRRPLWEVYLVEGLAEGRVAVITKSHHAMVDGTGAIEIGQVIFDTAAAPSSARDGADPSAPVSAAPWTPSPEPSTVDLVLGAVTDLIRRPATVLDVIRLGINDLRGVGAKAVDAAGGLAAAARVAFAPAPPSPLNAAHGEQRRIAVARAELADLKAIRFAVGAADISVNDVVLAAVAGALRAWFLYRGEPVSPGTTVRALVPVGVQDDPVDHDHATRVAAILVDLPIGEPSAALRLRQVAYATLGPKQSGNLLGAKAMATLSGFAPPTLHALGVRAAAGLSHRVFNVVISNVPGPQRPLYAAGARMVEIYPLIPLAQGQSLAVGVTSYDGQVFFGFNADRDALPDVDQLAELLDEALAELLDASGSNGHPPSSEPGALGDSSDSTTDSSAPAESDDRGK